MKIVLDERKTCGKRKNPLQDRFDKLRSALEKKRQRNDRFRRDLDELVEIYHRRSMENDTVLRDDLVALSGKLIVFAGRKSLAEWHRVELDEWLRDLIERRIPRVDVAVAEQLRGEYQQAIACAMGVSVEEMKVFLEAERAEFERDFAEPGSAERADHSDDDAPQDDLFGSDNIDFEDGVFEDKANANDSEWMRNEEDEETHIGRTVMDGSWAKDLFRRAAQVLHPDRELDPELRLIKQERMQELLAARKQGDIMALLTICSASLSGGDIVLPEQQMTEICDALKHQLEALELEKEKYIYSHPQRLLAFEFLYHGTKKGRAQRIEEWEQELQHEKAGLRELVAFLRNLHCLKSMLEQRCEERFELLADQL